MTDESGVHGGGALEVNEAPSESGGQFFGAPPNPDVAVAAYFLFLWKTSKGMNSTQDDNWFEAQYILESFPGWEGRPI